MPDALDKKLIELEHRLLTSHEHIGRGVAVANRTGRYLVSEDSDFGKGHVDRALAKAGVTAYLRQKLGLTVHDAKEARNHLSGARP